MKEEVDQDVELDKMDDNRDDENPYSGLIVNNAGKIENTLFQMEQWLILSNTSMPCQLNLQIRIKLT